MANPKQIDAVHGTILTSDGPKSVTGFPYDEVDFNLGLAEPGDGVSMGDVSSALIRILQWICGGEGMASKGARACALSYFLCPTQSEYASLEAIGQEADISKAAVSAALLELRRAVGLGMTLGKRAFASESYSKAQKAAVAAGTHSSFNRKDANLERRARAARHADNVKAAES
jgi:hypothetical protein